MLGRDARAADPWPRSGPCRRRACHGKPSPWLSAAGCRPRHVDKGSGTSTRRPSPRSCPTTPLAMRVPPRPGRGRPASPRRGAGGKAAARQGERPRARGAATATAPPAGTISPATSEGSRGGVVSITRRAASLPRPQPAHVSSARAPAVRRASRSMTARWALRPGAALAVASMGGVNRTDQPRVAGAHDDPSSAGMPLWVLRRDGAATRALHKGCERPKPLRGLGRAGYARIGSDAQAGVLVQGSEAFTSDPAGT